MAKVITYVSVSQTLCTSIPYDPHVYVLAISLKNTGSFCYSTLEGNVSVHASYVSTASHVLVADEGTQSVSHGSDTSAADGGGVSVTVAAITEHTVGHRGLEPVRRTLRELLVRATFAHLQARALLCMSKSQIYPKSFQTAKCSRTFATG
ncbi:hypothetical protein CBL_00285 [Carabus blaptoides fortunei]